MRKSELQTGDPVVIEDDGAIRIVRICRPEKRNALDLATKRRLVDAFRAAEADAKVGVVVLTGSESVFVAGTDIAEMAGFRPTDLILERAGEVFEVLDGLAKPVILIAEPVQLLLDVLLCGLHGRQPRTVLRRLGLGDGLVKADEKVLTQ